MILDLRHVTSSMKRVYALERKLAADPQQVALAQALTLNKDKPLMGLKGRQGLFGSLEWWDSIKRGEIPTTIISGIIQRTYFAGQDSRWGDEVNSLTLRQDDGSLTVPAMAQDVGMRLPILPPRHIMICGFLVPTAWLAYFLDSIFSEI